MKKIIENRFKDKVIIITGAAGGIGKQTAIRAAKEGAKLVLADRKEEMSKDTLKEIKEITNDVEFIICDLLKTENCKKVIDTAIEKFGAIDILVNNAGIMGSPAPVHISTEEAFREIIDTNIMIAFNCSHFALAHMIKNENGGAVVNVSSIAGITGFPTTSGYVTSKHGLNGLTKNMALDYAKYGIRVNSVNPASTYTPMYEEGMEFVNKKRAEAAKAGINTKPDMVAGKINGPQNRVADAEELSDVILFLASPEASNITGAIVPVDGGYTCF